MEKRTKRNAKKRETNETPALRQETSEANLEKFRRTLGRNLVARKIRPMLEKRTKRNAKEHDKRNTSLTSGDPRDQLRPFPPDIGAKPSRPENGKVGDLGQ